MVSNEHPVQLTLQGVNELWDAMSSLALTRFLSGEEPFAETLRLTGVTRANDLVPPGSVQWHLTDMDSERILARASDWSAFVQRSRNGAATVAVTAPGPEELAKAVSSIRSLAPVPEIHPGNVEMEFWHATARWARSIKRRIDAPQWDAIAQNYPASVRAQIASLVELTPPVSDGRLILWHGPPGTGKTTAIRALVRAWSGWCQTLFIVDAERFLSDGDYLMSVLLDADDYDELEGAPRWRLLVLEDADELLRASAKRELGQSLSRLLSLGDGLIGQGLNVLVLITTNEPIGRMHPAVARPGRCLADVEFGLLSRAEAEALGGTSTSGATGAMTLAEVFERRGQLTKIGSRVDDRSTGQYL